MLTKIQTDFVQYVTAAVGRRVMRGETLAVSDRVVRDVFPEPPRMIADIRALAGLPDAPTTLEQFRSAIRQSNSSLDVVYDFLDAAYHVG